MLNVAPIHSRSRSSHQPGNQPRGDRSDACGDPTIPLRSATELAQITEAGQIVAAALRAASSACRVGATTGSVDAAARAVIVDAGAESLFLDYPSYAPGEGFPGCTCVSVNEEVVHGVPGSRILRDGDIVTIDCGVRYGGWCADAARTVPVGRVRPTVSRMIEQADSILAAAIDMIRPGLNWSVVARRMQRLAEEAGYGVVRAYVGHGVGRDLHEPPQVPAFLTAAFLRKADFTLRPGMVLAIEPMLTLGDPATGILRDGWTVVTRDGEPACHVEHTVAVTQAGAAVLTDGIGIGRPRWTGVLKA